MRSKKNFLLLSGLCLTAFWFAVEPGRSGRRADDRGSLDHPLDSRPSPPATSPARLLDPLSRPTRGDLSPPPLVIAEASDERDALTWRISQLGVADVRGCLEELHPDELRGNLGRLLVRQWAATLPADAARWAAQLGDSVAREELSAASALVWSEHDLPAALAWAQSLTAGSAPDRVLTDLGYELARTDPLAALRVAAALPATEARDALSLHALRQAAEQDSDAFREWAAALPMGTFREQALAVIAISIPDGPTAARLVADQMSPGLERDRAVIGVVQRWAQVDHVGTTAWVAAFPSAQLKETAVQVLATFEPKRTPAAEPIR